MENRNEVASMLIKFYNMQTGLRLKSENAANQNAMLMALDKANGDVRALKDHIREWVRVAENNCTVNNPLWRCCEAYSGVTPATPVAEQKVTDTQVNYSMGLLENAVVQLISNMNSEKIEKNIMGSVENKVREFIASEYGTIERKIVTVIDGQKKQMSGVLHEKFETVLKFVANNEPVFLTGPAGSGKNVLCKQVAEALNLKFYFTNAVTQEYKLTGFTDAMGNYQPTQFYKAFTEGGLFMLDEMDASIPEVLVILNAAIANRYFDFPAPIGYVEAHPDFRVIAAGNTTGHGADFEYVGRNQLDGASLDRFAIVKIDYDKKIENSVANGDLELADFCRAFRKSAMKNGLNIIVSYRAIGRIAKMIQLLGVDETLETCLVKGIEKDDVNAIYNRITKESTYKDALGRIMRGM